MRVVAAEVRRQKLEVRAQDGVILQARAWIPKTPQGLVCLVHGFGEHTARYERVATQMTRAGLVVVAFDQRGHGRSPGPRGFTPSYAQLVHDIDAAVAQSQERFEGLPTYVYGHSMGGGEVLNYLLRHEPTTVDLRGAVVTSPWLELSEPPGLHVEWIAQAVERVWPTFQISHRFERGRLSHDPSVDEAYFSDPYVHSKITAPLFAGVCEAGRWTLDNAHRLDCPLLLMHGTADRVTSSEASARFAAAAPKSMCTWIPWEGLFHELHNEYEGHEVVAAAVDWMLGQSDQRPAPGGSTASAVTR